MLTYQKQRLTTPIQMVPTAPTQEPSEWLPNLPVHAPRGVQRYAGVRPSPLQVFVDTPTEIRHWQPADPKTFRRWYRNPRHSAIAITVAIEAEPTQEAGEWLPPAPRRFVTRWRRNPRQSAIAITSAIEAATIAEWLPTDPNTFRVPRQNRPPMAYTPELLVVSQTSIDQWMPYEPNQFRLRGPQRNYTAHTLLSGFEATPVEQWQPRAIRRVPLAWAVHPMPAQTVQPIVIPATELREWEFRWRRIVPRRYQPRRDHYLWALEFVTPPPEVVTFPLIIFAGGGAPAGLVSTQDIITWVGLSQAAAGMSSTRVMQVGGVSQHTALVSAIDLLTWTGISQGTQLISQARGGG